MKKKLERVYTLRCTVHGCHPRIWRRLVVRETMWLSRLHDTIQVLFDWFDYQTHTFTLEELRFGNPVKREDYMVEDDRDVTVADLDLENREQFSYRYDFGVGWQVDIKVDKHGTVEKGMRYPACVAGERAGPPEDCGGLEAYHDMLACLKEPNTDLGREWREWVGPDYNPVECDLDKINVALRKLAR